MKRLFCVGVFLFLSSVAAAGPWYIGAGLGAVKADDASSNVSAGRGALAPYGIDGRLDYHVDDTSFNVLAGYWLNGYFALEGALDYLGDYTFRSHYAYGRGNTAGHEEDSVWAFSVAGLGALPVNHWFYLYGKAGVALPNDDMSCAVRYEACASESDSRVGPVFGVGGDVFLGMNVHLRAEYSQFRDVGDHGNEYTAGKFSLFRLEYIYDL